MAPPGPARSEGPTPAPSSAPPVRATEPTTESARTPEPGSPEALMAAAGNAAVAGLAEDGSFRVDLGRGIHFSASELEGGRVDFGDDAPQPVPGLRLRSFEYRGDRGGTLQADLHVPLVDNLRGGVRVRVDGQGRPSFQGTVEAGTRLGVFQNPRITLRIDEERKVSGTLSVGPSQLTPRALRGRLEVTGEGTIRLTEGRLSGSASSNNTCRSPIWACVSSEREGRNNERGNNRVNVVPASSSLSTSIVPPWASTILLAIDKPIPAPS